VVVGDGGTDDGRRWAEYMCLAVVSVPRGSWLEAAKGHVSVFGFHVTRSLIEDIVAKDCEGWWILRKTVSSTRCRKGEGYLPKGRGDSLYIYNMYIA
jgi:hypothetical protein